jgi:coenzyme F420-0:L-glutamate ligase/coenzyme F420-1:gamma-L-glutamate ligase
LGTTEICVADELAAAAELVMGKTAGIPAAVIRGVDPSWFGRSSIRGDVVRDPMDDLFR